MVRALIEGRKTQTRRITKLQDRIHVDGKGGWLYPGLLPYAPGDRLYVREAWSAEAVYDDTPPRNLEFDSCQICYDADQSWSDRDAMSVAGRLRPSIHMPRWASRLTLNATDVRVQRLQEISEADAKAEGAAHCETCNDVGWINSGPDGGWQCPAHGCGDPYIDCFRKLWISLHGTGAWDANPWVIAISFQCTKQNIDQITGGS
jgi:hypothetical protein